MKTTEYLDRLLAEKDRQTTEMLQRMAKLNPGTRRLIGLVGDDGTMMQLLREPSAALAIIDPSARLLNA